ncbi:Hsp70 protein-domain-containing protein [Ilyonectria sp. MPI-CAGE-AT-0026]|nr:Hsp70 protein-domain-containing protein [Ilyonectria sp. MPI-CAGE-AT-0026]
MPTDKDRGYAIGIDLGTENTRVAVFRDDRVEIIPDEEGRRSMPSYVAFTERERLIGSPAKSRITLNPENTIHGMSRFLPLGFSALQHGFHGQRLPGDKLPLPFHVSGKAREVVIEVDYLNERRSFTPTEILAMILSKAKQNAEAYLGCDVRSAVLSVPVFFSMQQRYMMVEAGIIAGLKVMNVVLAPCAVGELWALHSLTSRKEEHNIVIFDLGARSLSILVATVEEGIIEDKAVSSNWWIGGDHLLNVLVLEMVNEIKQTWGEDVTKNKRAFQRLRKACEDVICALSSATFASMDIDSLLNGRDFSHGISRDKFVSLCEPILEGMEDSLDDALRNARVDKHDVHNVILAGGSSRIPHVQRKLIDFFQGKDLTKSLNPEEAGVSGLAIRAAIFNGDTTSKSTLELLPLPVFPTSIGIELFDGSVKDIVSHNTIIPIRKQECFQVHRYVKTVGVVERLQQGSGDTIVLATIDIGSLRFPTDDFWIELECTIYLDVHTCRGSCTVTRNGHNSPIKAELGLEDRLPLTELERLKSVADIAHKADELEARRVIDRNLFDTRIASLLEAIGELDLSEQSRKLLRWLKRIRVQTDEIPFAAVDEMLQITQKLDEVEDQLAVLRWNDPEATRLTFRKMLESKIESLLESAAKLEPSQKTESFAVKLGNIRRWLDKSQLITIADRQRVKPTFDAVDRELAVLQQSQLLRNAVKERLGHVQGTLQATTQNPEIISFLGEIEDMSAELGQFAFDEPDAYNQKLTRLDEISQSICVGMDGPDDGGKHKQLEWRPVSDTPSPRLQAHLQETQEIAREDDGQEDITIIASKANHTPVPPPSTGPTEDISASAKASAQLVPKEEHQGIDSLFSTSTAPAELGFKDADFERISVFLRNTGQATESNAPRLYTVLRLIDQLDTFDAFMKKGITDMWFPFTATTLPSSFKPSARSQFLDIQSVVFSKGFKLEKGSNRKHAHFSQDDVVPFKSIAKLGIGAHGVVDKVMSTTTHREYARKLFRRVKGLRPQDVKTFITELTVLKRVDHKHCVELVASYSDPKFFALLMEPVGDYNLAKYYDEAKNNADKLSLLRSFFGCLANAVQYLHNERIRHRDIKPQNIIVKGDCVLLTDFGIAFNWENLTRGTTTADSGKTLAYAAPEVVRVESRNEAADTWSLGCVFLEMVTVLKGKTVEDMRRLFRARSENHYFHANREGILKWMEQLQGCAPTTDNPVLGWVKSMLQPDQAARPTAAELTEDIVEVSTRCTVLFCGSCCHQGADSSTENEDDGHLWEDSDD